MMEASRINLLGLRSSRTVSLYLESAIDRFYPHVRQLSNESEFLYDKNIPPECGGRYYYHFFGLALYQTDN